MIATTTECKRPQSGYDDHEPGTAANRPSPVLFLCPDGITAEN